MIGDSDNDVEAGQNAGCKESIKIEKNKANASLESVNSIVK